VVPPTKGIKGIQRLARRRDSYSNWRLGVLISALCWSGSYERKDEIRSLCMKQQFWPPHRLFQSRGVTFIKSTRAPPDHPARLNSTGYIITSRPLLQEAERVTFALLRDNSATKLSPILLRVTIKWLAMTACVRFYFAMILALVLFVALFLVRLLREYCVGGRDNTFIANKMSRLAG